MAGEEPRAPKTPDEELQQDPGIPGVDVISERYSPPPDEKDAEAEVRERVDDADEEGHQTSGEIGPDD